MNNPIKIERDTHILDWRAHMAALGTGEATSVGLSFFVRSDGLTHAKFATLSMAAAATITAVKSKAAGFHMSPPKDGDFYTPYQYSVKAMTDDINVRPMLLVGESPASYSSTTVGDAVGDMRLLASGVSHGGEFCSMEANGILVANENTAGRSIAFAVAFAAGAAGATAAGCWIELSVRRLMQVEPLISDFTKL